MTCAFLWKKPVAFLPNLVGPGFHHFGHFPGKVTPRWRMDYPFKAEKVVFRGNSAKTRKPGSEIGKKRQGILMIRARNFRGRISGSGFGPGPAAHRDRPAHRAPKHLRICKEYQWFWLCPEASPDPRNHQYSSRNTRYSELWISWVPSISHETLPFLL